MTDVPVPGTVLSASGADIGFARFAQMIEATSGLTLSQVCALTGLEASTVQNWIKRGFVPRPVGKKYRERHLARILLISSLRDCMQIDRIGELMTYINGDTESEDDDIISEVQLYDYLCSVCISLSSGEVALERVADTAAGVAADFDADDASKEKLTRSLTVMAYAYLAGLIKRESERRFADIFNT